MDASPLLDQPSREQSRPELQELFAREQPEPGVPPGVQDEESERFPTGCRNLTGDELKDLSAKMMVLFERLMTQAPYPDAQAESPAAVGDPRSGAAQA